MRRSAIAPSAARRRSRNCSPPPAFSCRAAAGTRPTSRAAADPRRRPKAPLAARAPVPPASPIEGCQLMSRIRRYLMTGLLVWLPLGVTIFVVMFLVNTIDQTLLLLPPGLRPDNLLGYHIPGLGVLLTVGVILLTGIVMAHFFGREILAVWESILNRIPLVRSIYTSVKQLSETLLSTGGQSFRNVLLIEYPRRGSWTLAFQTGTEVGEAQLKTGEEVINVYVPTTPNPTSLRGIIRKKPDVGLGVVG